jgi:hypothetical protein
VCASGCNYSNLQTAIDASTGGDIIEIQDLGPYSTSTNFTLRQHSGGWITIRGSAWRSFPPGVRATYENDRLKLPKICNSSTGSVFKTETNTSYWHLQALWITVCGPGQNSAADLVLLGDSTLDVRPDLNSHHFRLENVVISGYDDYDPGPNRGLLFCAANVELINSDITHIKNTVIESKESHAMASWCSPGNITVRNSRLAAASENFLLGGARAPYQGLTIDGVDIAGSLLEKDLDWFYFHSYTDPGGATLPGTCNFRGQLFQYWGPNGIANDSDDQMYLCGSDNGSWKLTNWRPTQDSCLVNETGTTHWRNITNNTVFTCTLVNGKGRWQAGGTDQMVSLTRQSTSVTEGNPTRVTINTGISNLDWDTYQWVNISGVTGGCSGINGRRQMVYVGSTTLDILYDTSTCGTITDNSITIQFQFQNWDIKNGGEFKNVRNARMFGNVIRNTFFPTFGQQKAFGFMNNLTPAQDGPTDTIQFATFESNKFLDNSGGLEQGAIVCGPDRGDFQVIKGVQTIIDSAGSSAGCQFKPGETIIISGAPTTNEWNVLNGSHSIADVINGDVYLNINSTTFPDPAPIVDISDNSEIVSVNRRPGQIRVINNLFRLGTPMTFAGWRRFAASVAQCTSSESGYWYTDCIGRVGFLQFPSEWIRNTIVKPLHGENSRLYQSWTLLAYTTPTGLEVRPKNNLFLDNLVEGGHWQGYSGGNLNCVSAISAFWDTTSPMFARGNVNIHGGQWTSTNAITATGYNQYGCETFYWAWDRNAENFSASVSSATVSVDSAACPSNPGNKKLVLNFSSASRLLPGSLFRISNSSPADLNGDYTVPSGATDTTTSWTLCPSNNPSTGTYTGVTIRAGVQFTDYDNADYRVSSTSIYKGKASDGADPGADLDIVDAATAGAISGNANPYLDMYLKAEPSDTSVVLSYRAYDMTACTVKVSTTRAYTVDLAEPEPTHTRTGIIGTVTVSGLTPSTNYYARLSCAGKPIETTFITKPTAISELQYFSTLRDNITTMRGANALGNVTFGCHLVFAQGNGFVDSNPAVYENLTVWQDYVDNLANAGCSKIVINVDLRPWIANDTTDITRYTDIFTYIKTTKGLQLELAPQATAGAKTAIQALAACPNGGNPCYDGTFDSPGDWFQGAKGAMRALAQLATTARPHRIVVVHEPTTANSILGISGTAAQWDAQVNNFANDTTYGIQNVDTTIAVGAGCHTGESSYCALFSDRAGVDFIGLDFYDQSTIAQAVSILADARAADGSQKECEIEETSRSAWTNTGTHSEQSAIHGVGYARFGSPVCFDCQWLDGVITMAAANGCTSVNLFWTQPLRYYAADGAADNGLSVTYNSNVAGTPDTTLTTFGNYTATHPNLQ